MFVRDGEGKEPTLGLMRGNSAMEFERSVTFPRDRATMLEAVRLMYDSFDLGV